MRHEHALNILVPISLILVNNLACRVDPDDIDDTGDGGDGGMPSGATVRGRMADDSSGDAVKAEAWIRRDGDEVLVGSGEIGSDGLFELELEADQKHVTIWALDVEGQVMGGVVLPSSGHKDDTVYVAPIGVETTVEARIYGHLADEVEDDGGSLDDVNVIDLLARVDADLAAAVQAYDADSGNGDLPLRLVAEAMLAVQATQDGWLAAEGHSLRHGALEDDMVAATASMYTALYADAQDQEAIDAWMSAMFDAWAQAGVGTAERGELEALAGLSGRLVLAGGFYQDALAADLLERWALRGGRDEAMAVSAATSAIVVSSTHDGQALGAAGEAGDALEAQAQAASSVNGMREAFDTHAEALIAGSEEEPSVLAHVLGTSDLDQALLLTLTEASAVVLEASLWTRVGAGLSYDPDADTDEVASACLSVWDEYESQVWITTDLAVSGLSDTRIESASALLVQASGSFRGVYADRW